MSENSGVYLKVDEVEKFIPAFETFGNVLNAVNMGLEAAATLLKLTAYTGLVGGAVVTHYIASIKPVIKKMADKSFEISRDIDGAVRFVRDGDDTGSKRFMN
jgi:hypothetical protein